MTLSPMFSPKMGLIYFLLLFIGAVVLNNSFATPWIILGGTMLVIGMVGVFFSIVNNYRK
ncbi:MAG TPA: hypothetical protein PL173_11675 [Saprospiraceae bacterium]|nr:hypothetical protein [Saprospiraceae bacterium]HNG13733.1 hypothetical protein [Saprospiraceae bacterium]